MSYSDEALAFSTISPGEQVSLEDRISFAYLEYCTIVQEKTGVVALQAVGNEVVRTNIEIPVSSLAVLCLGPGTSITTPALTSITRCGCTVIATGGGGTPYYSHATPLTSSARWAIAQANLFSQDKFLRAAALHLYKKQLGMEQQPDIPISRLRGLEGAFMKNTYQTQARKHGLSGFKRDTKATDPVNAGLNIANGIFYGCAATACSALAINPALGIIHRGDCRSLLFDLADLYKPTIVIPTVFSCAKADDPLQKVRLETRKAIHKHQILKSMMKTLMEILEPHLPAREDDRLIGGRREEEVAGHTNYK